MRELGLSGGMDRINRIFLREYLFHQLLKAVDRERTILILLTVVFGDYAVL